MKPGWFRGYTDARNWTPRHGLLVGTLTLCTALVGFSSFSPHGSPAGPEVPSASIPDVGAPGVPAGSAPPADAPCEEPPSTLGERINGEFRRDGDHVAELVGVRDPDTGNLYLGGNLYARDGGRYSTGDL